MSKFSKLKAKVSRQFLFLVLAVFLFIAMAVLIVYNFIFLISSFDKVFGSDGKVNPQRGFDIGEFEKLNLIRR